MDDLNLVKQKFNERRSFFGSIYYSARLSNKEITIDNFVYSGKYLVCLCTKYNENIDRRKNHDGMGGGEVKKAWFFESEEEALGFIWKSGLI